MLPRTATRVWQIQPDAANACFLHTRPHMQMVYEAGVEISQRKTNEAAAALQKASTPT